MYVFSREESHVNGDSDDRPCEEVDADVQEVIAVQQLLTSMPVGLRI